MGGATCARSNTASEPVPRPNAMVLVLSVGATKLTADFRSAAVVHVKILVRPGSHHCPILPMVEDCTCERLHHLRARRSHRSSRRRLNERNCELAEPPKSGPRPVAASREEPPADPLQGFHRGSLQVLYRCAPAR